MKKRTFISKTTAVLLSLSVAAGNLALDPSTSLGAARHTKKYTFSTAEKVEKAAGRTVQNQRYVLPLDEGTSAAEAGKGAKTVHWDSRGGKRPANRRISAEWL